MMTNSAYVSKWQINKLVEINWGNNLLVENIHEVIHNPMNELEFENIPIINDDICVTFLINEYYQEV